MFFKRPKKCRPPLEQLYKQVCDLGNGALYTGFAILCKDLTEFFAARGATGDAVDTFRTAYNNALGRDFPYLAAFHPKAYANLPAGDLPAGLTERANNENFEIPELTKKDLTEKLSPFIGWAFFREYSQALKDAIEEAKEAGGDDEDDSKSLPEAVKLAEQLLGEAVPDEHYLYPVILYLSLLLYRTEFQSLTLNDMP